MSVSPQDVTVVIPSLPERSEWLGRAVRSVEAQTVQPAAIVTYIDQDHIGAFYARNKALEQVRTPWVQFLDDDDRFYPEHLATLIDAANRSSADLVGNYPDPDRAGMDLSLFSCRHGIRCLARLAPWGPEQLDHLDTRRGTRCPHCGTETGSFILVTNLVRFDLVEKAGGFPAPKSMGTDFEGYNAEDYLFLLKMLDVGAKFHKAPGYPTWMYHVK